MVIAIGTQKGGTGKTSTVHALGDIFSERYKVLLVDMDPQASLTKACGLDVSTGETMADVMRGDATIGQAVHERDGYLIAASSRELANVELGLVSRSGRTEVLRKALEPAKKAVDVILIDLPPSLSLLTVNGLTAAEKVIIPARPTMLDVTGLSLFLETVEKAKKINPRLEVMGVLLTFYDPRIISMKEIIQELERMGLDLFETRIGQSVRVAEAAAHGESVVSYAPNNKRATEYRALAKEIL